MSVRNLLSRAGPLSALLVCFLAACGGGTAPVNVGSGGDGSVEAPRDSGTTLPGDDAGSGADSGTCPVTVSGSCSGTGTGSDAGTGSGTDAGTGSGSDGGTGPGVEDGGPGTGSDAGSPTSLVINAGPDATLCAGGSALIGPAAESGLEYSWSPAEGLSSASEARPTASPSTTTTYVLTVRETATGRTGTDSVVVTVNALPVASAGVERTIGKGSSVRIGAPATGGTAPYRYAWSATPACDEGSCLSSASAAQPDVTPAESTLFTVVVTDAESCSASDAVRVTVAPALVANAGGNKSLCAGQSTSIGLLASGGVAPYTYTWSVSPACTGCLSSTNVASPTATPSVTTTFTQRVSDAISQTASASAVVTVYPNPGSAGANQLIDPGASTLIGPTPVSGATYAWSCNRADCALSATNTAQPVAGPTRSTIYTLDATNGPGCSTRSTLVVQVTLTANTVPQDGELAFPLKSALLVQFDQPIAPATLTTANIQLEDTLTGAPVAFTHSYDATTRQLRVVPTGSNYISAADYTLTLVGGPSGIASDDAVQPSYFPADMQVDFTTAPADTTPPGIYFRGPGVGATNVANNTTVAVTFTEAVDPTTVTGGNFRLTSPAGPVTGSVRYDSLTWTATFTPSAVLAASTTFTVSLAGIKDLSGNAMTTATNWSFTTGLAPDTTPPTLASVVPVNGSTAVASSDPIVVTFSEPTDTMTLFTGIRLFQVSTGTYVAGTITYDPTQRIATFTPTVLLGSQTTYEVQVNGVKDLAGNAMAAPFTSRFTTRRTLFADNFESGTGAWTLTNPTGVPWSLTTSVFHSSNHSLTDSASGKYAINVTSSAELAAPLSVSGLSSVSVQFWMKARTERNRDFVYVDASIDGGAWTQLTNGRYSGNLAWAARTLTVPLSGSSSTLRLRFRFTSNASRNFDGVYVDDIIVQSP